MGMNLFEEAEDDVEDISKIKVDVTFARRFEHNKKREDLQRYEEMKKKGQVDESEEESDEDDDDEEDEDVIGIGKSDLEFFDALVKVKNKDPILNERDVELFESEPEEESEEIGGKSGAVKGKGKAMHLKDVVARNLIELGPEFEEEGAEANPKSYSEEKEAMRRVVMKELDEAFDDGDEGELFVEKRNVVEEEEGRGGDDDRDDEAIQSRLDEYFGGDDNLDENEMFLKNFFRNKMWVDRDGKGKEDVDVDLVGLSEDEEAIEKQDKYEAEFNFRFEEGVGDRVVGHARFTEDSVRKKNNARKEQRRRKKERLAQAKIERKEELKRLENLKREEAMEKLKHIRSIGGIKGDGAFMFDEDYLDGEFDPDVYDKKAEETFGEDYYEAEDNDPTFHGDTDEDDNDLTKPDFDKEDEMLGLEKGWADYGPNDGFLTIRNKIRRGAVDKDADASDEGEQGEHEVSEEDRRKRKSKLLQSEKAVLENLRKACDELHYEDEIGDIKTRFKYRSVPSRRYGLNTAEVLAMDEKELNQYVPLKKLATFSEREWKVPKIQRYNQKSKNKQVNPGDIPKKRGTDKKQNFQDPSHSAALEHEKDQNELNGESGGVSKQSRKRRRKEGLKLSESRLKAYGRIPNQSKNKQKH
ncbi:hypothetical protein Scep_005574 [Stephania cephalantha]|uniref:Kri1-like C-terminal domain-containing protein n=1 Tax=Stephania cephalantha TaxID=152367 RepID=A0AAP0KX70_9MAGN